MLFSNFLSLSLLKEEFMFGNHTHSHNGGAGCKHSHELPSAGLSVGFEDDENKKETTVITLIPDSVNGAKEKQEELLRKQLEFARKKEKELERAKTLEDIANKNYSQLNAVKAVQYGILDRLKELVDSKQCDPLKPDKENVYLLHWAAYNNRLDIAQYLLSLGHDVDQIGGELG